MRELVPPESPLDRASLEEEGSVDERRSSHTRPNGLILTTVNDAHSIAQVAVLAATIWREHYTPIIGAAQVEYMLETVQSAEAIRDQIASGLDYRLAWLEGKPAGYFAVLDEPDACFVSKFYVDASYRGHGLGRYMLAAIESHCREHSLPRLWLTVNRNNAESIAAYEAMGFVVTGTIVQDIGGGFVMDDFRMEKALTVGSG